MAVSPSSLRCRPGTLRHDRSGPSAVRSPARCLVSVAVRNRVFHERNRHHDRHTQESTSPISPPTMPGSFAAFGLTQPRSQTRFMPRCRAMLAGSPEPIAEEWRIDDHEGFGGVYISEWAGFEDVHEIALLIEEHGPNLAPSCFPIGTTMSPKSDACSMMATISVLSTVSPTTLRRSPRRPSRSQNRFVTTSTMPVWRGIWR